MLTGDLVTLRGIERDDFPALQSWAQAYDTWPEVNVQPLTTKTIADTLAEYDDKTSARFRSDDTKVPFAVTVADELVGSIGLWGIDQFNRGGHLGITIGPSYRGKGYGTDACRVLLRFAFVDRGLHRVQLETLSSNLAGQRAYAKAGFVVDGVLRQSAWARGELVDEVIMSVLSTD